MLWKMLTRLFFSLSTFLNPKERYTPPVMSLAMMPLVLYHLFLPIEIELSPQFFIELSEKLSNDFSETSASITRLAVLFFLFCLFFVFFTERSENFFLNTILKRYLAFRELHAVLTEWKLSPSQWRLRSPSSSPCLSF